MRSVPALIIAALRATALATKTGGCATLVSSWGRQTSLRLRNAKAQARSEPHTAPSTLAHAASACANVLSRVSNPRCRVWLRSKRCRSCRPGESSIHKISSPMRRSCGIIVFAIGKRPSCTRSKHCSTRTRNRVVGSEGCEQRGIGRWASGSVSVIPQLIDATCPSPRDLLRNQCFSRMKFLPFSDA